MTNIFYLITSQQPLTVWHVNTHDLIATHISGGPFRYFFINPKDGKMEEHLLSPHITKGGIPQLLVPGGVWSIILLE